MWIYKQELAPATFISKNVLPYKTAEEARNGILKLDLQCRVPCIWYLFDEHKTEEKEYIIFSVGAGHEVGDTIKREEYIGTVIIDDENVVFHYFLIEVNEFEERCKTWSELQKSQGSGTRKRNKK